MVTVVHQALLQGALWEQGDIYHPDFSLGYHAYFDLSIKCTTQPAFISSTATQGGVDAAAS